MDGDGDAGGSEVVDGEEGEDEEVGAAGVDDDDDEDEGTADKSSSPARMVN